MTVYPESPDLRIVAFDLDDTLARGVYPSPEIGEPDPAALAAVAHYASLRYEVVIFTARPASHGPRIRAWLERHGIDCVYDIYFGKPRAGLYFDDRAVRWPLGS